MQSISHNEEKYFKKYSKSSGAITPENLLNNRFVVCREMTLLTQILLQDAGIISHPVMGSLFQSYEKLSPEMQKKQDALFNPEVKRLKGKKGLYNLIKEANKRRANALFQANNNTYDKKLGGHEVLYIKEDGQFIEPPHKLNFSNMCCCYYFQKI